MNVYRVDGMTCDGCALAVTRAVQRIAPARDVRVDRAGGRLEIGGDRLDDAVLRAAIEEAGFAFGGRG